MRMLISVFIFVVIFSLVQIEPGYGLNKARQVNKSKNELDALQKQPQNKGRVKDNGKADSKKDGAIHTSQPKDLGGKLLANKERASGGTTPKLDIVLVLDNSGSMKENDPKFLMRAVVTNFVNDLGKESRLGMVLFDKDAQLAQPLKEIKGSIMRTAVLKSLNSVNYKGQFTNIPAGIERAIYELKTNGRKDVQKIIIFLTDGIVDTGDKNRDLEKGKWLRDELAQESKKAEIRIIGIAFTDKADFHLIQTLSHKTDGEYFRAYKAEDIQSVFNKINEMITRPTKAKIETATVQVQKVIDTPSPVHQVVPSPTPAQEIRRPAEIPMGLIVTVAAILLAAVLLFVASKFRKASHPAPVEEPGKPDKHGQTPPQGKPMPPAQLIDVKNVIFKEPMVLDKRLIKIGRGPDNEIMIPGDPHVSGFHATIEFKKDENTGENCFYLKDQESSNGTTLNGEKLQPKEPAELKNGDRIKFDVYEFRFLQTDRTIVRHRDPSFPIEESPISDGKDKHDAEQPDNSLVPEAEIVPDVGPDDPPSPVEEPQIPDGKDKHDPDERAFPERDGTKVKPGEMCPKHPSEKLFDYCRDCHEAVCPKCMGEKHGKTFHIDCPKAIKV